MTVIEAVQNYIQTYTGLPSGAPVWVDYLGLMPSQFTVQAMPGARVVEIYLDGSRLREFPFVLAFMGSTADDAARLANVGFFEAFADWLEQQTEAEVFPTLLAGKTPEKIEALGWGYLFELGESETGVYQIQCRLTYMED